LLEPFTRGRPCRGGFTPDGSAWTHAELVHDERAVLLVRARLAVGEPGLLAEGCEVLQPIGRLTALRKLVLQENLRAMRLRARCPNWKRVLIALAAAVVESCVSSCVCAAGQDTVQVVVCTSATDCIADEQCVDLNSQLL
jgi:hypothetical protein